MNWKTYALEFASVFIAVVAAFALNNWNDNRRDAVAESKILREIRNGLLKDKEDIVHNLAGHGSGVMACEAWHAYLTDRPVNKDSLVIHYAKLLRDFVSIQNRAGYESLKSKGLETIKDDSLRLAVIDIYEYDFNVLITLEEDYYASQFYQNYFTAMNDAIVPWATFDSAGNMVGLLPEAQFDTVQTKALLSYLWRVRMERRFIMEFYRTVDLKIDRIVAQIDRVAPREN